MITAASFLDQLRSLNCSFHAGVPCSFLKPFINAIIDDPSLDYIGAASEGEAIGITAGAFLAGRKTITMCQNSGLGNMVNPLTSLNAPFRIPTLLIITWRGQPGLKDEPQHDQMGRITLPLLATLEIPSRLFPTNSEDIPEALAEATASMQQRQLPFALVMTKDTVEGHPLERTVAPPIVYTCRTSGRRTSPGERPSRTEAIRIILESLAGDEAIIATTGKTGRELFTLADRPNHLYVVGSMGAAAAIGLGLAQAAPHQPVVVLDGDGALLMKLGVLATIGIQQPARLLHVVLDNESYDSTGGQRTSSVVTRFADLAAAANYRQAIDIDHSQDLAAAVRQLRSLPGPSLLHIRIKPGSPKALGRPTLPPREVKDRFMDFIRHHQAASAEAS